MVLARRAEKWAGEIATEGTLRFDDPAIAKLLGVSPAHFRRHVPLPPLRVPSTADPRAELAFALNDARLATAELEAAIRKEDGEGGAACRTFVLLHAAGAVGMLCEAMRASRGRVERRHFQTRARLSARIKRLAPAILPEKPRVFGRLNMATVEALLDPDVVHEGRPDLGIGYDLSDFAWKCARCGGCFFALTRRGIYCPGCKKIGRREAQLKGAALATSKRRARMKKGSQRQTV